MTDALLAQAGYDVASALAKPIGETDDSERSTVVTHEDRCAPPSLDVVNLRVQGRRAELSLLEQPMAAHDCGRRRDHRFRSEPRKSPEFLTRHDGQSVRKGAIDDRTTDRMLRPR